MIFAPNATNVMVCLCNKTTRDYKSMGKKKLFKTTRKIWKNMIDHLIGYSDFLLNV